MKYRKFPEEWDNILCGECGASMSLKESRFGYFYGCKNWVKTKCRTGFSAFQDTGRPFVPNKEQRYREFFWKDLSLVQRTAFRLLQKGMKGAK